MRASAVDLNLRQRIIVVAIMLVVGLPFAFIGGLPYALLVAAILGAAAWEYWRMFSLGGFHPSRVLLIGGTVALVLTRHFLGIESGPLVLTLLVLASMAFHTVEGQRGHTTAAEDFGITVGGILYVGWLGSYFISLRNLPGDGLWYLLLVIPAIGIADAGAYFIGRAFGHHPMASLISPHKTWEGYSGGVGFGAAGGLLLALLWHTQSPTIQPLVGLWVGLVLAMITPMGDLGESMFKRHFGVKDASQLLPGHGGVLDRIDSWLWGGAIGYYLLLWLVL